tara:strand:- start:47 stop:361 length:315 start_codon:yes stop_codon:yes gene_type:complete
MGKSKRTGKNGEKEKKEKKEKKVKTEAERLLEVDHIKRQINDLGLGDGNPDVKLFLNELELFVSQGNSWSGKIPLNGFQRIISATLSTNPNITSSVTLEYATQK